MYEYDFLGCGPTYIDTSTAPPQDVRRPCGDVGLGGEGGLSWNVTSDHLKLGGILDLGSEYGKCKDDFMNLLTQPKRGKGLMCM